MTMPVSNPAAEHSAPYAKELESAVRALLAAFKHEPATFLYEADLRARLYCTLADALIGHTREYNSDPNWPIASAAAVLRINPVKAEYPEVERFDVAVLDPAAFQSPENYWNKPVAAAVELKFTKGGERLNIAGFAADVAKLRAYRVLAAGEGRRFTGVALLFVHHRDREKLEGLLGDVPLLTDPAGFAMVAGDVTRAAFLLA